MALRLLFPEKEKHPENYRMMTMTKLALTGTALFSQTGILLAVDQFTGDKIFFDVAIAGLLALLLIKSLDFEHCYLVQGRNALAMTLMGACGMALGLLVDLWEKGPATCALCQPVPSWSLGLMLVFCFLGCRLFPPLPANRLMIHLCGDGLCAIGMVTGMITAGIFIIPFPRLFHMDFIDLHWIMLVGMFVGNLVGIILSLSLSNKLAMSRRDWFRA